MSLKGLFRNGPKLHVRTEHYLTFKQHCSNVFVKYQTQEIYNGAQEFTLQVWLQNCPKLGQQREGKLGVREITLSIHWGQAYSLIPLTPVAP